MSLNLTDDFPPLISLAPPRGQLVEERGAGVSNQHGNCLLIDARALALACCALRRGGGGAGKTRANPSSLRGRPIERRALERLPNRRKGAGCIPAKDQ